MSYKNYRYRHEKLCTSEPKPVKAQAKPKAKVKMMPKPTFKTVEVNEQPQETPKQVIKQIPQQQPTNPLMDITNHCQLLQNQYIQQKKKNITIFVRVCLPQNLKRHNNIIFSTYNYIIMSLTLDGSTSFIGAEFIKLLATGSSPLATEEYVDDKVADAIGGSSADAYTKSETDALLNAKLNVSNPDVSGNLRIEPTSGGGKLIINATSPINNSNSFFCNGTGQFNSSLRVAVLTSDGDVNAQGCNANTFNVFSADTKISFNDDTFEYMKYENPNVDANFYGLKVLSNLYTKDIYPESIKLTYNNKISFIDTNGATDLDYYNDNFINITIDEGIQRLNQVIMGNGRHRFYCGSIDTANDGDLVMKMDNSRIDIYKDLYLNGSTIGDTLNVSSIVSSGNIQTASTIKSNNFENYDDNNIVFSHNGLNYLGLIQIQGQY